MKTKNLLHGFLAAAALACMGVAAWEMNETHMRKAEYICRNTNAKADLMEDLQNRFGEDIKEAQRHDCKIPWAYKLTHPKLV